ncbi:MAG: hypothetical protein R3Y13_05025 [bacterium]
MNCIIPFTKDVKFGTPLGDIISISLEHEFNFSNNVILGNFIISGTFKTHELSANALDFNHILPFDLSLTEEIDESSINFSIDNFTYEVMENDILKINIDYLVKGKEIIRQVDNSEIEAIFDAVIEEVEVESFLDTIIEESTEDVIAIEERINQEVIHVEEVVPVEDVIPVEVISVEESIPVEEVIPIDNRNTIEPKINVIEEIPIAGNKEFSHDAILNFASNNEESFVSYKVHVIKEGETVDTLCSLYSKTETQLIEYNTGISFNPGDKILIPEDDE